jgi:hypothetical protein
MLVATTVATNVNAAMVGDELLVGEKVKPLTEYDISGTLVDMAELEIETEWFGKTFKGTLFQAVIKRDDGGIDFVYRLENTGDTKVSKLGLPLFLGQATSVGLVGDLDVTGAMDAPWLSGDDNGGFDDSTPWLGGHGHMHGNDDAVNPRAAKRLSDAFETVVFLFGGRNGRLRPGDMTGLFFVSTGASDYIEVPTDGGPIFQAVPLPAAVWLLGAGLMGLVGSARRRVV